MFKKKPQIKNLSPLRSSERRKLADQIRKDYTLPDPQPQSDPSQQESDPSSSSSSHSPLTLTDLRNTLLPETTQSAKFSTTHGPASAPVSGTLYVGAHPGQDERVLWFQIGKDPRLIPTVYTLWHNPNLLPLLHTGDVVIQKLKGGADLFAPGVVRPRSGFDERTRKDSIVAAASVRTDTVPRWVGVCDLNLGSLQGDASGTAAHGLHWEGDELWTWSAMNKGGRSAPDDIPGWHGLAHGLAQDVEQLDLDDEEGEVADGGVAIDTSATTQADHESNDNNDEYIPTTAEIDAAFTAAFLYSIYDAKKSHASEPYGLPLPIQPSFLIANMINPYLRIQSSHYNIKKTSWKNAKKFIKHLDKQQLLKSKDRNGGETVILDVDFNDQQITSFTPYKLPKPKSTTTSATNGDENDPTIDTSLNQTLTLQTLYRSSPKLVPDLLASKTAFYTTSEITSALKSYIDSRPELLHTAASKKRYVKLDPFLSNTILHTSSPANTAALAAGEIDRSQLARRVLEDSHLCSPYHILLRNCPTYDPATSTEKPRAGAPPKVTLTIERRGGNKTITAIAGLEHFFINPQLLRPELQKRCAGSASVSQHVGGKPGMLEVTVQGDQRDVLTKDILVKRGVRSEWIDIVDKTKKKKK